MIEKSRVSRKTTTKQTNKTDKVEHVKNIYFLMSTGIESHVESRSRMLLKLDLIVFNEMFFFQMIFGIITLMMLTTTRADVNTESCKDMLQGYLSGQLSSALGAYQVEALRREFKSFTDVIENSMKMFKEKIDTDMKTIKG